MQNLHVHDTFFFILAPKILDDNRIIQNNVDAILAVCFFLRVNV